MNQYDPRVPAGPAAPSAEASAPAAAAAPAPGEVCRVTVFDPYASPARDRDQLVIVTGQQDPETGAVPGFVIGYAEDVEASFRPEDLTPA